MVLNGCLYEDICGEAKRTWKPLDYYGFRGISYCLIRVSGFGFFEQGIVRIYIEHGSEIGSHEYGLLTGSIRIGTWKTSWKRLSCLQGTTYF